MPEPSGTVPSLSPGLQPVNGWAANSWSAR
jgi:hypothetical protein